MDTRFSQALHLLVYISETGGVASSQALAASINTNASHVRKITGLLKAAGLIASHQGRAGFHLAVPKKEMTLAAIYRAVYPDRQLFIAHEDPNPDCPVGRHIRDVLQPTFDQLQESLYRELEAQTLDDLINKLYASAPNPRQGEL